MIKIETPGPVFFKQKRVGKNLKEFEVLKFRTMTDEKREVESVIGMANGVTKVGYYLRRLKIDELPQLVNVLKGEMSLVGPRPSVSGQLEGMNEKEKERFSIKPGLTGLAQVCGNIHLSWTERYKYDRIYVKNISFFNDIRIMMRTVLIIIKGEEEFLNNPLGIRKVSK